MSASCYVGCTAPPVKPPTVLPPLGPHNPLAFTGAGPGIHVMLAVGIALVAIGAAILLATLLVRSWRKAHPYVLKIDTSRKARAAWYRSTPSTAPPLNVVAIPTANPFHLLPHGVVPPAPLA